MAKAAAIGACRFSIIGSFLFWLGKVEQGVEGGLVGTDGMGDGLGHEPEIRAHSESRESSIARQSPHRSFRHAKRLSDLSCC
jgi:hypothetical protein